MEDTTTSFLASFDIGPRFTPECVVGYGAYGTVIQAHDYQTNNKVAIKKLNKLDDIVDAKRNLREIRTMRCLNHDSIMNLIALIHKQ